MKEFYQEYVTKQELYLEFAQNDSQNKILVQKKFEKIRIWHTM